MLQTSIVSQNANVVTVSMSRRRWNHLQKLEESYKVANAIRRGMKQAERHLPSVWKKPWKCYAHYDDHQNLRRIQIGLQAIEKEI